MSSILVIQFRTKPELLESERVSIEKAAGAGPMCTYVNAIEDSVNWDNPEALLREHDALVLGGSGEFDFDGGRAHDDAQRATSHKLLLTMKPLLDAVFEKDMPTFGICFGHQLVGAHRGAEVVHDPVQSKVGTFDVALREEGRGAPLFEKMPPVFAAQYGHKDSLSALPEGAELIVEGRTCNFSGLRYSDNIYTVQFHPEMDAEDVRFRLDNSPGYLPEGVSAADVVRESPHATQMLKNFFTHIVQARMKLRPLHNLVG